MLFLLIEWVSEKIVQVLSIYIHQDDIKIDNKPEDILRIS